MITVSTGSKIEKIEGFIGNYKTTVKARDGEKIFEHGVVIVAIGAYENKPKEYLYGQNATVKTQRELETMIYEKDAKLAGVKMWS